MATVCPALQDSPQAQGGGPAGGDRREATTGSDRGARRAAVRAGRGGDGLPGPRWPRTQMAAPRAIPALHPASIVLRVQAPGGRPGQQGVHQGPQDRGRVHDLSFTGAVTASYTNLQTGKTITGPENGPGKATIHSDGSITEVHTGRNGPFILAPADAKRFGLPTVSVTAGRLAFSVTAPPRVITSLSLHGHVLVNVCAALS